MSSPTHHRAIALVLTVVLAIGLARAVRPPPASPLDRAPEPPPRTDASLDAPDASTPLRLDPNVADLDALARLPGIGPTLARRIAAARDAGVRFARADDLRAVRGIGPRTVARIAPYLALPSGADAALDAATDPASSAGRPDR